MVVVETAWRRRRGQRRGGEEGVNGVVEKMNGSVTWRRR
jgi:hypothetical protein